MKRARLIPFVAAASLAATAQAAVPLPALKTDANEISVSGLSSGGYMAVQLHVAYSATFRRGAGVVAAGPFYCAEGSVANASGRCLSHGSGIPVASLVSTTNSWASSGWLDPVANLAGSKVYLFSGTLDKTVVPAVVSDLKTYYRSFVPAANIVHNDTLGAGHAMVTDDHGAPCGTTALPHIVDCDVDLAGEMLKHLHGPLKPRNDGALTGSFVEFDQRAFAGGRGMAATGWVYLPRRCASGRTACRVHVVLHGCGQNVASIGDKYVRTTGYNRWADNNDMIVLYPQTSSAAINGCWDWWGYDYARRSGPQMAAIKAMVARLGSRS
ncbi:MAG: hypothetical protein H7Y61_20770 [Rhizobiales bacterium]|nr:hypothetical protein [Rhizobacter sp.]